MHAEDTENHKKYWPLNCKYSNDRTAWGCNVNVKTMPLSYHGFAPAAILLMVLTLAGIQLYEYWKHNGQKL